MSAPLYLAYGSNLHPMRLAERLGPVEQVAVVELEGFEFAYNKRGRDGSAKANLVRRERARAFGVVYRFDPTAWPLLDRFEGPGYRREALALSAAGIEEEVHTYLAPPSWQSASMQPYDWYRGLVVRGGRYHGFPEDYLDCLRHVMPIADPDPSRRAEHQRLVEACG